MKLYVRGMLVLLLLSVVVTTGQFVACGSTKQASAQSQGPASPVPLYSTTGEGSSISNSGQEVMSLTGLPAGTYQVFLRVTAEWASSSTLTNQGARCDLQVNGVPVVPANTSISEIASSATDPTYVTVSNMGPASVPASGAIDAYCFNWGISNAMTAWSGTLQAIPVTLN